MLIAGSAVGAGILGLPVQTGKAGVIPAGLTMVAIWGILLSTAWVLATRHMAGDDPQADLPTLYQRELGAWGKWLAVAGYLVIYYGIMVAYLAGAASVLANLLDMPEARNWLLLAFFAVSTALSLFGLDLVRRGNTLLMILILASFVFLIWQAGRQIEPERLLHAQWPLLPSTVPLILTALAFHNIIPSVCRTLGGRRRLVFRAMLAGTALPLVVCLIWTVAVVGALPLDQGAYSLQTALAANQPATVPLAASLSSPDVTTAGLIFSLCAILSSFLPVGAVLMVFLRDLLGPVLPERSRTLRALLVFAPPLAVVYLYPDLFLVALDVVGGVGLVLLYLILPALMLLKTRGARGGLTRLGGWILLLLAVGLLCIELLQELNRLGIGPDNEFWKLAGV